MNQRSSSQPILNHVFLRLKFKCEHGHEKERKRYWDPRKEKDRYATYGVLHSCWRFHPTPCPLICSLSHPNRRGHPMSIFGKYLFERRFEIWNFRNICCKIFCLPASPRIFEHLKNDIIAHT